MKLEEAGVDIIDVSGVSCGSRPAQLQGRPGYFISQAQHVRKVVDLPVIGFGVITEPAYADELTRKGRVDLVAVGRTLLKDPDETKNSI